MRRVGPAPDQHLELALARQARGHDLAPNAERQLAALGLGLGQDARHHRRLAIGAQLQRVDLAGGLELADAAGERHAPLQQLQDGVVDVVDLGAQVAKAVFGRVVGGGIGVVHGGQGRFSLGHDLGFRKVMERTARDRVRKANRRSLQRRSPAGGSREEVP